jgi:hypothetical protein
VERRDQVRLNYRKGEEKEKQRKLYEGGRKESGLGQEEEERNMV